jgi:hypothetical protein
MEINESDSINAPITLSLPRVMALPVQTDAAGFTVPATGFVWSKYLDHDTLHALGVTVEWRHADGSVMSRETALRLIDEAHARGEGDVAVANGRPVH